MLSIASLRLQVMTSTPRIPLPARPDIPQVACRLIARSADFAARSSDLHSKPGLRLPWLPPHRWLRHGQSTLGGNLWRSRRRCPRSQMGPILASRACPRQCFCGCRGPSCLYGIGPAGCLGCMIPEPFLSRFMLGELPHRSPERRPGLSTPPPAGTVSADSVFAIQSPLMQRTASPLHGRPGR